MFRRIRYELKFRSPSPQPPFTYFQKIGILQPVKDSKAEEKQIPFVIVDSRQASDDHVEILLLSVVERDGDEQVQSADASGRTTHASAFLNRLDWISVESIRGTAGGAF